ELGGGSVKVLTRGVQWAAFNVDAPPKFQFVGIIQASDADAAKALHPVAEKAVKLLAQQDPFRGALPDTEKVLLGFRPKLDGDRLTLTVDENMLASLLVPIAEKTRSDAPRVIASNNMKQLGQAMFNYELDKGSLPPLASFDKQGKPLLSWRVHLLPHLGEEKL